MCLVSIAYVELVCLIHYTDSITLSHSSVFHLVEHGEHQGALWIAE